MAKNSRLLFNIAALGLGTACSKLAVFLLMPLYTAALTPAQFGSVDILINTAALLLPLISLHLPETIFRFAAEGENEGAVLAVGKRFLWVGGLILCLVMPFLAAFAALRPYLIHLFCYVAAATLHSYASYILRARGQYGLFSIQQIFCTLVTVSLAVLFLPVLELGVGGYLAAVYLADGLTALILYAYLRPPIALEAEPTLQRSMLRYCIPLIPTALLWWVVASVDRYFLLWIHGKAVVGIYAAAYKLPALMTFAAGVFLEGWHYAALHAREAHRQGMFERFYGALLPVLISFSLLLILGSDFLVEVLFAADFAQAASLVPFLAIAILFSALSSFLGSVYVVKRCSKASLATAALGACVHAAACALLIPKFAAAGAVAATMISYFTVFLRRAVDCRRMMPFSQHMGQLTLSVCALLVVALLRVTGHDLMAWACAPLTLLPFWVEIRYIFRFLYIRVKKIRIFSTKREKRS